MVGVLLLLLLFLFLFFFTFILFHCFLFLSQFCFVRLMFRTSYVRKLLLWNVVRLISENSAAWLCCYGAFLYTALLHCKVYIGTFVYIIIRNDLFVHFWTINLEKTFLSAHLNDPFFLDLHQFFELIISFSSHTLFCVCMCVWFTPDSLTSRTKSRGNKFLNNYHYTCCVDQIQSN